MHAIDYNQKNKHGLQIAMLFVFIKCSGHPAEEGVHWNEGLLLQERKTDVAIKNI
ncbi:MAG: hypothetical protein L3J26_11805 [Candidatus Polarisedimenticolaceae bacterium]|nr:hypothetical protein [Candidatus Polarisedimenticolaceae bacterium]